MSFVVAGLLLAASDDWVKDWEAAPAEPLVPNYHSKDALFAEHSHFDDVVVLDLGYDDSTG